MVHRRPAAALAALPGLLALLLAPIPPGARAATSPAPAAAAAADTLQYEVEPLTVSAARPRATTTGGASALEVTLDSSRVRPAATLEDVLRAVPLVAIRRNSRGEAQPALRGGEDRHVAVLVDGVPITLSWDQRTDLSVIPLTAARKVTLHRGLSSLLSGPNALGGAIEVDIARGAREDSPPPALVLDAGVDHTGARSASATGGLLRGDEGGRWLARAGVGYRGSSGFVLPAALRHSDAATAERLTADGDRRLNSDAEGVDGFLSLRRVSGGGAWATLTALARRFERGVVPEAHTAEPRLWRYPSQTRGIASVALGTGMRETPWGRGDLELGLGLDAGHTLLEEYDGLDYRVVSTTQRDEDRTRTARLLGDHTLGRAGDLRMALTFADVLHEEAVDGGPRDRYRQRLWSFAAESDWRVHPGVPVRVSAGAALDAAETPVSADKPPLGRLEDWAARLGATATLRGGALVLHGSIGRRARFPGLRELYSGARGRFLENPDLRAERVHVGEMGATWRGRDGELQVVAFHQALDGAITRVAVETPEGNKFQRVNLGRVGASGVEIVGERAVGPLEVALNLALQRVRGEDGEGAAVELEYEPAVSGGVGIEAPLPGPAWIAAQAQFTGRQHYLDLDRGAFSALGSSARIDLRAGRRFGLGTSGPLGRLDAEVAIENVADRPVYDQAGLPQPGRTVRLQVRLW
jgi:iron complex outermembrane receptor protein